MAHKALYSTSLTETQYATLKAISEHLKTKGEAPTHAELAQVLGLKERAATNRIVALENKGYLVRTPAQMRGMTLSEIATKKYPELAIRRAS